MELRNSSSFLGLAGLEIPIADFHFADTNGSRPDI
jgi:hypothetical protein